LPRSRAVPLAFQNVSHTSAQATHPHESTSNTQRKPGRALTPKPTSTSATISTMRCSDPLCRTPVGTGARPVRSTKRRIRIQLTCRKLCLRQGMRVRMRSSVFSGDHYIVSPARISEGILRNRSGYIQPRDVTFLELI
jgi:hypothetical protein